MLEVEDRRISFWENDLRRVDLWDDSLAVPPPGKKRTPETRQISMSGGDAEAVVSALFTGVSDAELAAYWKGELTEEEAAEVKRLIYSQEAIRQRYSDLIERAGREALEELSKWDEDPNEQ